ncbi:hypothetical protein PG2049B_0146 [Bifidobacterium pseudolongum subsp. globosum]|uniref:Uncharacterized protein n=1 Tax=Bifidobacterium pseudolongum subsp. globosum TaxID=1690 RepID=A0A4V1Y488_9BIFI|nr:hypothetical protein [Bifidobacterium pseudolongum]RYQ23146.1 hypothetical protein PG2049B_0146 [Bifidobacterium pseudolongum subsp. globosum]RYQ31602.1 hypothetical protein PG2017B_0146 [Bifidobacterium pseudolongum subsp. globosum]
MSTTTVLRLMLETLTGRLHAAISRVCEADMNPLAETGELLRIMQIMQHEAIGSEHDREGDKDAKRRRLRRLREKIARLRENNEHPVGNSHEAAYLANARIKTDDVALAMIDDALKGL